jgi:hypothetical protein
VGVESSFQKLKKKISLTLRNFQMVMKENDGGEHIYKTIKQEYS